jgi:hypothetical protein
VTLLLIRGNLGNANLELGIPIIASLIVASYVALRVKKDTKNFYKRFGIK